MRFAARWAALLVLAPLAASGQPDADSGSSGSLVSVGSDTLRPVMERWAAEFSLARDGVRFEMESKGSSTAPPALIEGRSNLAPMSRPMTDDERDAYEARFGREPVFIRVGLDALGVYVHEDNPLRGISIPQLDGIFSKTRECGGREVTRWGDVVMGPLARRPITAYGRDELSGSHASFREKALCGGRFRDAVRDLPDSAAVIRAVGSSVTAIGYAGIGYRSKGVRALSIAARDDDDSRYYPYFVERHRDDPDPARRHGYVVDGRYPLSRSLQVYIHKPEGEAPEPLVASFLEFTLSERGQQIVEEAGFVPLPRKMIEKQRDKLSASYKRRWWSSE